MQNRLSRFRHIGIIATLEITNAKNILRMFFVKNREDKEKKRKDKTVSSKD